MFGVTRWSPIDELFSFQREVDRLFNQFWSDLPTRTANMAPGSFQVNSTDDAWRIDVPLPGIDPQDVILEVAGNTLSIRVEEKDASKKDARVTRYEQTLTIPQFLDVGNVKATHQHGMLRLAVPVKESVKPRRVQIEDVTPEKKQLAAA